MLWQADAGLHSASFWTGTVEMGTEGREGRSRRPLRADVLCTFLVLDASLAAISRAGQMRQVWEVSAARCLKRSRRQRGVSPGADAPSEPQQEHVTPSYTRLPRLPRSPRSRPSLTEPPLLTAVLQATTPLLPRSHALHSPFLLPGMPASPPTPYIFSIIFKEPPGVLSWLRH